LLREATRRRSLLLIEHRLDDLAGLVDRVAVLDGRGGLALEGPPARVFRAAAPRLDALGVWTPQYAALARLLGAPDDVLPASAAGAADLLVAAWPGPEGATAQSDRRVQGGPAVSGGDRTGPPLLSLEDVAYRYRGAALPAVEGITLDVRPDEFVALVGA